MNLNSSTSKCRAKDPRRCWKHGITSPQAILERKIAVERKQKEEIEKLKFNISRDFSSNLKRTALPDGREVVSVYRSGILTPPAKRGVEKEVYEIADRSKPEDRTGRTHSIYASMGLGAANRWVRGNSDLFYRGKGDPSVNELQVDIDNTYLYHINAWERISNSLDYLTDEEDKLNKGKEYWETGISVRDYLVLWETDPGKYNPREWELLINPSDIIKASPVKAQKVAIFAEDEYEATEVTKILKAAKKEEVTRLTKPVNQ